MSIPLHVGLKIASRVVGLGIGLVRPTITTAVRALPLIRVAADLAAGHAFASYCMQTKTWKGNAVLIANRLRCAWSIADPLTRRKVP